MNGADGITKTLFSFFKRRLALKICAVLLLALLISSLSLRFRTYLVTRKIHAALFALQQIRPDITTEDQLLKIAPYLTLGLERQFDDGEHRFYRGEISNEYRRSWVLEWAPEFFFRLRLGTPKKYEEDRQPLPVRVAYLLGWRNLSFVARATVLNGKVSSAGYGLETDIVLGFPVQDLMSAHSSHGFWMERRLPVPVSKSHDEAPDFRFLFDHPNTLTVAYLPKASAEQVRHVFQLDLGCFWNMRGCDSAHQVAPLLWTDRKAVQEAAIARLGSKDSCPDRVLAGRVRTLNDVRVELLEIANVGTPKRYRLIETIRGEPRLYTDVPSSDLRDVVANRGDRVLYFSGATFDSCRIVPATPSALSVVRAPGPGGKRFEDDLINFYMVGRM